MVELKPLIFLGNENTCMVNVTVEQRLHKKSHVHQMSPLIVMPYIDSTALMSLGNVGFRNGYKTLQSIIVFTMGSRAGWHGK